MKRRLVIPVHPPKISWLLLFLTSLRDRGEASASSVEIWLICSHHEDVIFFSNAVEFLLPDIAIRILNVESYIEAALGGGALISHVRNNVNDAVINVKKFIALHHLHKMNFNFLIVIDADSFCIGSLNTLFGEAERNYATKRIYGAGERAPERAIPIYPLILAGSASLLSQLHQNRLQLSQAATIFTWFLSPPSYQGDDLCAFFEYMEREHGDIQNFMMKLTYYTFDHVVFTQFLAATRDFELFDYTAHAILDMPESLGIAALQTLQHRFGFHPVWIRARTYLAHPLASARLFPNVAMLCHMDRN